MAIAIKSRANKTGRLIEVEGCDISPVAVEFATKSAQKRGLEVRFFQHDALEKELPEGFDLVSSSLFLHHLSDSDSLAFLKELAAVGQAILVQDLLRTRMGYILALSTVRVITRSRVVRTDGPRSVRSAFSLPEVERMALQAGLEGARIERCWPERFSMSWGKS